LGGYGVYVQNIQHNMALGLAGDVYVSVAVGCIQELHLSLQFVLSDLQLLPLQILAVHWGCVGHMLDQPTN